MIGDVRMGASRIEQIIEDIYDFIDGCKSPALSSNKVIVPKDTLYDLLDDLRLRTPEEIKRYQKIIANRDTIISDAEAKAEATIAEAEEKAKKMLEENEIMHQAFAQANELVSSANEKANAILESAKAEAAEMLRSAKENSDNMVNTAKAESDSMVSESYAYANDLLFMIENVLNTTVTETKSRFDAVYSTLNNSLNVVRDNREQINRQTVGPVNQAEEGPAEAAKPEKTDDFDYDDNK